MIPRLWSWSRRHSAAVEVGGAFRAVEASGTMLADLDLLLTMVFYTADQISCPPGPMPSGALSDSEVVTLGNDNLRELMTRAPGRGSAWRGELAVLRRSGAEDASVAPGRAAG